MKNVAATDIESFGADQTFDQLKAVTYGCEGLANGVLKTELKAALAGGKGQALFNSLKTGNGNPANAVQAIHTAAPADQPAEEKAKFPKFKDSAKAKHMKNVAATDIESFGADQTFDQLKAVTYGFEGLANGVLKTELKAALAGGKGQALFNSLKTGNGNAANAVQAIHTAKPADQPAADKAKFPKFKDAAKAKNMKNVVADDIASFGAEKTFAQLKAATYDFEALVDGVLKTELKAALADATKGPILFAALKTANENKPKAVTAINTAGSEAANKASANKKSGTTSGVVAVSSVVAVAMSLLAVF